MPGSWQPLNNQPSFNVDAMLLLTDGSIMCHEYLTPNWQKLVPDKDSDYGNGTWHPLSPMPLNAPLGQNGPDDAPLYFASAVLRDGAGGEYNVFGAASADLLTAELYDPVTDVWTPIATPLGWTHIGEASSFRVARRSAAARQCRHKLGARRDRDLGSGIRDLVRR